MKKIRFTDGPKEEETLKERYKEKMYDLDLSERDILIWELGFDCGVDDEGIEKKKSKLKEKLKEIDDRFRTIYEIRINTDNEDNK